jgi:hypothetical protein
MVITGNYSVWFSVAGVPSGKYGRYDYLDGLTRALTIGILGIVPVDRHAGVEICLKFKIVT